MRIPLYWAEARIQHRRGRRHSLSVQFVGWSDVNAEEAQTLSVQRLGWSDVSAEEAQRHADARVRDAFVRIQAGERLPYRERRTAYLGTEGVPIREEILERHGSVVITRNRYGAHCLNVPDVLFADVDLEAFVPDGLRLGWAAPFLAMAGGAAAWFAGMGGWSILVGMLLWLVLRLAHGWSRRRARRRFEADGGAEQHARRRIEQFVRGQPQWRARLYRTPNGFRLMATHRRFAPGEPAVSEAFEALGVDPVYRQLCRQQDCFRARLTAKPWRIGITQGLKPGAAWQPEHAQLPERQAWIADYEARAAAYAACSYVETLGRGRDDPEILPIRELHDRLCRATVKSVPLA